jgi:hypothetical protein
MGLIRRLVCAALKYNIVFKAKHGPGKLNVVSDAVSFSVPSRPRVGPVARPKPDDSSRGLGSLVTDSVGLLMSEIFLLKSMFSLMFYGFLRIREVTL